MEKNLMNENNDKLEKLALEIVNESHLPAEDFVCVVLEKVNKILNVRKCSNCRYFSSAGGCDWMIYSRNVPIWLGPDIVESYQIEVSKRNEETKCNVWEKMK
jgi:hypothetical protein